MMIRRLLFVFILSLAYAGSAFAFLAPTGTWKHNDSDTKGAYDNALLIKICERYFAPSDLDGVYNGGLIQSGDTTAYGQCIVKNPYAYGRNVPQTNAYYIDKQANTCVAGTRKMLTYRVPDSTPFSVDGCRYVLDGAAIVADPSLLYCFAYNTAPTVDYCTAAYISDGTAAGVGDGVGSSGPTGPTGDTTPTGQPPASTCGGTGQPVCAVGGTCGAAGQPVCPNGGTGAAGSTGGSTGASTCGGIGQPVCATGGTCGAAGQPVCPNGGTGATGSTGTATGTGTGTGGTGGTSTTACGSANNPCKIDENGTPSADTGSRMYDGAKSTVTSNQGDSVDGVNGSIGTGGKDTSWHFSFNFPTGCSSLPLFLNVVVNACDYQEKIHSLMSMCWLAATVFCMIGMVGRTVRGTV